MNIDLVWHWRPFSNWCARLEKIAATAETVAINEYYSIIEREYYGLSTLVEVIIILLEGHVAFGVLPG